MNLKKEKKYCLECGKELSKNNKYGYCKLHTFRDHTKGYKLSNEHRKKISEGMRKSQKFKKYIKNRDVSGQKNSFYGRTHSEKTKEILRVKCKIASQKLWQNQQYREKVIRGVSKPRSQQGRINISKGVKRSYDKIPGLRESRSRDMKRTWQSGKMNSPQNWSINNSKSEYEISQYIKKQFKINVKNKHCIKYQEQCGEKRWVYPDIYLPELNLIIQYFGDFWHMNPKIYKEHQQNEKIKYTAKQIWQKDEKRLKVMSKLGYKVYVIWEYDYKNNTKEILNDLFKLIRCEKNKKTKY